VLSCAGARAASQPALLAIASDRADDLGRGRVYTVAADGSDLRRVSRGNGDDTGVVATRDGKRVAFLRTVDGATNVWVANADGSRARQVTHTNEPKQDLAWAPNGRRLAFAVCTDGSCRRGIDVVDADGAQLHRVVDDALQPSWSPDSRRLVYAGETQAYGVPSAIDIVSADGGRQRRIAPVGTQPRWQPRRGRWILYDGSCGRGGSLCVVRTDGRGRHAVADGDAAVWSPRGDRIAVVGNEVGLGLVRLRRPLRVRWVAHRVESLPAWSPDGRLLAYVEERRGSRPSPVLVVTVRVDSGRVRVARSEPPTTSVGGLAFVAGGRLTYDAEVAISDHELYAFRPGLEGVRQLTRDLVDERDPAWSRDGTMLAYVRSGIWSPRESALWISRADGTQARRVVSITGARLADPSWAPDGAHVVFVRTFEDSEETQVAVVETRALRVTVLPLPPARYSSPAFSPDGSLLALDADGVISLAGADGSDLHAVAVGTAIGASWSPDGTQLAYVEETAPGTFRLAVAEVATGAVRGVAAGPSPAAGEPAWSPDGAEIVFGRPSASGFDLFGVAPDGGGERKLTVVPGANVDPAFASS